MNHGHFKAGMLLLNHIKYNDFIKKKNTKESLNQTPKSFKLKRYYSVGHLLMRLLFPTLWTMANIEEAGKSFHISSFCIIFIEPYTFH